MYFLEYVNRIEGIESRIVSINNRLIISTPPWLNILMRGQRNCEKIVNHADTGRTASTLSVSLCDSNFFRYGSTSGANAGCFRSLEK